LPITLCCCSSFGPGHDGSSGYGLGRFFGEIFSGGIEVCPPSPLAPAAPHASYLLPSSLATSRASAASLRFNNTHKGYSAPDSRSGRQPYHKPSSSYPFRRDIMRHGPHSTDTTYPTAIASSSRSSSPPPPCTSPPRNPVCPSSLCSTGPRSHWPSHRNPLVVRVHRQRRPEGGIPACPLAPRRYYPTRLHLLSPPQRLPPRPLTPNGASLRVPARRATSPPPVRFPLPLPAQEEGQDP